MSNDMLKANIRGWKWHWDPDRLITISLRCCLSCVFLHQDMYFRNIIWLNPLNFTESSALSNSFLPKLKVDEATITNVVLDYHFFLSAELMTLTPFLYFEINSISYFKKLQAFVFISTSFIIAIVKIHIVFAFALNQLEERQLSAPQYVIQVNYRPHKVLVACCPLNKGGQEMALLFSITLYFCIRFRCTA